MTATARLWTCVLCDRTFGGNGHCDHCGRHYDGSRGPFETSHDPIPPPFALRDPHEVRPARISQASRQMTLIGARDEPDGIWRCHYCRVRLIRYDQPYADADGERPCREHVVPRSRGGSDDLSNLVLACWWCNGAKGSRLLSELPYGWADRPLDEVGV